MENLRIYNIGYFLASFPLLLGGAIVGRIFLPLFVKSPRLPLPPTLEKCGGFDF
jgi:hypothetical protein